MLRPIRTIVQKKGRVVRVAEISEDLSRISWSHGCIQFLASKPSLNIEIIERERRIALAELS